MQVIRTLAHVLQKNWPPGVAILFFFVILKGRFTPQPSQGRESFFFPTTSCTEELNLMIYEDCKDKFLFQSKEAKKTPTLQSPLWLHLQRKQKEGKGNVIAPKAYLM
jgi:hypothetical protein